MEILSEEVKDFLRKSFKRGRVCCITGAGISCESGIPAFRGKGGLWEKYDPQTYGYADGLISTLRLDTQRFIDFVVDFYSVLLGARPNPGHLALAFLEKENILNAVITQNIDDLHRQAGNRGCVELHGNALRIRCVRCLKTIMLEKQRWLEMIQLLKRTSGSYLKVLKILSRYFPRCECGGRFRIDIVLFGEMLPERELESAYKYLNEADTLLLIGTSLAVYPAASLPLYAKQRGVKIVEINSEPTTFSGLCDYKITGEASYILPQICAVTS